MRIQQAQEEAHLWSMAPLVHGTSAKPPLPNRSNPTKGVDGAAGKKKVEQSGLTPPQRPLAQRVDGLQRQPRELASP